MFESCRVYHQMWTFPISEASFFIFKFGMTELILYDRNADFYDRNAVSYDRFSANPGGVGTRRIGAG